MPSAVTILNRDIIKQPLPPPHSPRALLLLKMYFMYFSCAVCSILCTVCFYCVARFQKKHLHFMYIEWTLKFSYLILNLS